MDLMPIWHFMVMDHMPIFSGHNMTHLNIWIPFC